MKANIAIFIASLALVASVASFFWRDRGNTRVAFVSSQRIFESFIGTKDLKKKLNILEASHKASLDTLAMRAHVLEKSGGEAYIQSLQRHQDTEALFKQELQSAAASYTEQIWKQINQYTIEYGKAEGYTYILGANSNGTIMYANESEDITEKVLEYINRKYEGKGD